MTLGNPPAGLAGTARIVEKASGWLIAIAVVLIILGLMAMVEPMVAGLAVAVLVGWILIVAGVTHVIGAFGGGGAGRAIWHGLIGVLYVIGGAYFLMHPLLGLGSLTLLLAGILIAEALLRIIAYTRMRGERGASWLLVNGVITILLGAMIWRNWPSSSVWAIGTLVGVNLLMAGVSRLMLALAARSLARSGSPS